MICWAARNEKLILREGIWFYEEKIVCMDTDQKNLKKNSDRSEWSAENVIISMQNGMAMVYG